MQSRQHILLHNKIDNLFLSLLYAKRPVYRRGVTFPFWQYTGHFPCFFPCRRRVFPFELLFCRRAEYRIQSRVPGRRGGGLSSRLFQKFLCKLYRCCPLFYGIGVHIILYAVPLAQSKQPCRGFKQLAAVFAAGAGSFLCVTGNGQAPDIQPLCDFDSGAEILRPVVYVRRMIYFNMICPGLALFRRYLCRFDRTVSK